MSATILIVEDNETNLKLFRDVLEANGFQTRTAVTGHAALTALKAEAPDLIVMDIQLPDISGLQVTRLVRDDPALASVPIIAVTAFAMSGDAERILEAGCDAYMSKPISIEPFRNTINALLDGNTSLPEPPKRHPFAVSVARQ